jgi:Mn-dependent DtxR family transcriptional regulator
MNDSTVVRKKEKLKEDIVKLIKSSENPLSTSDLSAKLEKAWHTIDRTCLMLQIDGKIDGFKVGKMNLWRAK